MFDAESVKRNEIKAQEIYSFLNNESDRRKCATNETNNEKRHNCKAYGHNNGKTGNVNKSDK